MKSERSLLAKAIESEGAAEASRIRAAADSEAAKILAEADARATGIRSQGEAEAFKYYQVFEQNPKLAEFLQIWHAVEEILKKNTTVIMDPNTPPWNLLQEQPTKTRETNK
jgi:regulator of protease activity HflC (stomatin/prohibitin superfamily)